MKVILSFGAICCAILACFAYSPIIDGAYSDLRIHVVDDQANPVEGADVAATFYTSPNKVDVKRGKTDANGVVRLAGGCIGEAYVTVQKKGHYKSRVAPNFRDIPFDEVVKIKHWSRKPVDVEVILKRVVEPVSLKLCRCNYLAIPATNEVIGLDLETLQWCAPHGKGRHADAEVLYESWQNPTNWFSYFRKLSVNFPASADGFYVAKRDSFSDFAYAYSASTNANYSKSFELVLDRRSGKITREIFFADDEYLVFRTRTATNELGRVIKANYGRIGEKSDHMFGLRLKTWFNSTVNDTNLEDARLR